MTFSKFFDTKYEVTLQVININGSLMNQGIICTITKHNPSDTFVKMNIYTTPCLLAQPKV